MDGYDAPSMRFGLDNDYEEGEYGSDGEFYAKGLRQVKLQTKSKALYGVFDDSSDDEGGRRGKKPKANYSAPVGFVSGGMKKGAYEEEDEKKKGKRPKRWSSDESGDDSEEGERGDEDDEDDEDVRPRFGLGRGNKNRGGGEEEGGEDSDRVAQRESELPVEFGQRRDERKKKVAQKEEAVDHASLRRLQAINAGGLGLKLLQKMGYKGGGLGKDGSGISQALEAKKRENLEGLGVRKEHKLEVQSKEGAKGEAQKEKKTKKKKEFNWKIDLGDQMDIDKPRKKKKVYKTAEEIRLEAEDRGDGVGAGAGAGVAGTAPVSIVDMRGKEARLIAAGGATQAVEDEDADEAFTLPLLHNVSVLVDAASADIQRLTRQSAMEKDSLKVLENEHKNAAARVEEGGYHVARLEAIVRLIEETHKRAMSPESLGLDALADVFEELRTTYKEEYHLYQLSKLAGPLIVPPMRQYLRTWDPLQAPEQPIAALKAWRWLLRADAGAKDGVAEAHVGAAVTGADAEAFLQLVDEVLMPRLLAAAANWTPKSPVTAQLVRLLEAWELVLPAKAMLQFLETLVLPKLKAEIDAWNPRADPVPIHSWVHPWLGLCDDSLEQLYPVIRYKIGMALTDWHPSDASALNILKPWASVFQTVHMEALLARCVMPKLAMAVRELPINPANQVLEPFHWLVRWCGTAPPAQIAKVLETEFFPRWMKVLFQWLTAKPDYDEVTRWYLQWKQLVPEALQEQAGIKQAFTRALDMMNNVVAGAQIVGNYVQEGVHENLQYLKVTEQRSRAAAAAGGVGGGAHKEPPKLAEKAKMSIADAIYNNSVSFKEALQQLAEDRGMIMMPKAGKQQAGKQVYSFGKAVIYLDNRIVFALVGGAWKPLAIDDLLAVAAK